MTHPVHILSVGSRTPLGLHSAAAAAAVRAGISALAEHPFMVDQAGDPMPAALDAELDPALTGPARLLALAETALLEALTSIGPAARELRRLALFLALPEVRPGFTARDGDSVRGSLERLGGLPAGLSEVNVFLAGHAGGFSALAAAARHLLEGGAEACLVGGVDSYFQPDTMEWLDGNRQLTGAVSRSGFVPGEGAGFCLLAGDEACRRLGMNGLASVRSVALGEETKLIKSADVCLGEGLTATVRDAVTKLQSSGGRSNQIICDINGERYRGEEWGFVCLRLGQYFDDPTDYLSPAEYWGDVGAASAPLFAMLATRAAARGYEKGPRTLLWGSSEGGPRGAAVVETARH